MQYALRALAVHSNLTHPINLAGERNACARRLDYARGPDQIYAHIAVNDH